MMEHIKIILIIAFIFISKNNIHSQNLNISGTVTDESGKALPYVNVFIRDTFEGSMSDESGKFQFTTRSKDSLYIIATYVGYSKFSKLFLKNENLSEIEIVMNAEGITTDEILVTASSYSTEKEKGVVMSSSDIVTTPGGAADIFQALKTLPGLTQVSESAELYVRGGDPIETTTLIDQATIYHPYTFESAYGGLFSNINSATIKGMFFSSGGFSAKYGNSLSGVLELETKNDVLSPIYNIGVSMASVEGLFSSKLFNDSFSFLISGRNSFTGPIFWFNGGDKDFTIAPVSQDINLQLNYKYSNSGKIKLLGFISQDEQGVNVKRPGYIDVFNGISKNKFINMQISEILFGNLIFKFSLSGNDYESRWKIGILDITREDLGFKNRTDTELSLTKKINLKSGYEIEYRSTKFMGTIPVEDFDVSQGAPGLQLDAEFNNTRIGIYAEGEISSFPVFKNLYLIAGIRFDAIPKLNNSWIDPRLSLGYKLDENNTLSFASGIYHQNPDPRLFSTEDGNPNLKPMKANHFIASWDHKFEKSNFRIETYYKSYSFLPLEDENINFNNNGYGYSAGIDFMLKGSFFNNKIDGWISYGFIDTKRYWMDYEEETSSDYDITHNLTLVSKYNFLPELQIGINYKLATGRPYDPVDSAKYITERKIYEPIYGKKNSDRFPVYQRLDMRLTYLTTLFNQYFTVFYIEALNILNLKNIFDYSYNYDYSKKEEVESYFGRRTLVLGMQINL